MEEVKTENKGVQTCLPQLDDRQEFIGFVKTFCNMGETSIKAMEEATPGNLAFNKIMLTDTIMDCRMRSLKTEIRFKEEELEKGRKSLEDDKETINKLNRDLSAVMDRDDKCLLAIEGYKTSITMVQGIEMSLGRQYQWMKERNKDLSRTHEDILVKYSNTFEKYQEIYNQLPKVKERNQLMIRMKSLLIENEIAKKTLKDCIAKKNLFDEITADRVRAAIINFAKEMVQKSNQEKKLISLKESNESLREKIELMKLEKISLTEKISEKAKQAVANAHKRTAGRSFSSSLNLPQLERSKPQTVLSFTWKQKEFSALKTIDKASQNFSQAADLKIMSLPINELEVTSSNELESKKTFKASQPTSLLQKLLKGINSNQAQRGGTVEGFSSSPLKFDETFQSEISNKALSPSVLKHIKEGNEEITEKTPEESNSLEGEKRRSDGNEMKGDICSSPLRRNPVEFKQPENLSNKEKIGAEGNGEDNSKKKGKKRKCPTGENNKEKDVRDEAMIQKRALLDVPIGEERSDGNKSKEELEKGFYEGYEYKIGAPLSSDYPIMRVDLRYRKANDGDEDFGGGQKFIIPGKNEVDELKMKENKGGHFSLGLNDFEDSIPKTESLKSSKFLLSPEYQMSENLVEDDSKEVDMTPEEIFMKNVDEEPKAISEDEGSSYFVDEMMEKRGEDEGTTSGASISDRSHSPIDVDEMPAFIPSPPFNAFDPFKGNPRPEINKSTSSSFSNFFFAEPSSRATKKNEKESTSKTSTSSFFQLF